MLSLHRSSVRAYLIVLAGTGLVAAARIAVDGWLGPFFAALAFVLTVIAAGAIGGWKPGVLATTLCVGAWTFFFIGPTIRFAVPSPTDVLRMSAYFIVGLAISILCEFLRAAWDRIEERQRLLEQEVIERRKAELAVLEQAERLRQADRLKDEFLAILAHELRNPLSPLANALQLWPLVENDRKKMEDLRAMMERQVRQMTRLINDLLDISRITRGKIQLQNERVDLGALISSAAESLAPLMEARGHRLTVSLPKEPVMVEGDAARLTQVFGNILHNAAKYTGRDGLISIGARNDNGRAAVYIRDNGPGVPPHMLTQIFDMFQQVDKTLDRSHGGLGIGLTLAKRLVELHGGTIEARSDGVGKGTEFIVSLPLAMQGAVDSAGPRPRKTLQELSGLPKRRILVVDDMEASAKTLALVLRAMGQDVETAFDGQTALESLRSRPADIVFLDIAMPGMNGYDVARQIRTIAQHKDVCVVALTGYGQEEDRRRALEAGFDQHLTKPASVDMLQELLEGRRGSNASRRLMPT